MPGILKKLIFSGSGNVGLKSFAVLLENELSRYPFVRVIKTAVKSKRILC